MYDYFDYIDKNGIYQGMNPGVQVTVFFNNKIPSTAAVELFD